jgi:plasmid maintenance system antidote protein VapI
MLVILPVKARFGLTYFRLKYRRPGSASRTAQEMSFDRLTASLLEHARDRIRNGELTERGMARLLGISQPHAHNVLKGVRPLTPGLFDTMLKRFGMDLLDLYPETELELHLARRRPPTRAPLASERRLKHTG